MAVILYNIFLLLFRAGTWVASPFHGKAKKWVNGRRNIFEKLQEAIPANEKITWVHCASLGEFEQGRPVMEEMRSRYPQFRILLTFFSPSGYEAQKNYKGADWVFYLPVDGPKNAKRFLEIVHPSLVIFVKYEFWYYYLKKIKYRNIPLLLISALFRKDMSFFKWYGGLQRKMLSRFDHLFVQDPDSKKRVDEIGLSAICTVSGDTRFDRVIEIAERFEPIPTIDQFTHGYKVIVAGSTWPEDEEVLQKAFHAMDNRSIKLIIAPHEISEKHLKSLRVMFPDSVCFSELTAHDSLPVGTGITTSNCLIIDNIGMLSRLYKYGWAAYVGGGMKQNGVHNVLEAAVYNKIVFFGPYYHKYSEAVGLVLSGGGLSFMDEKRNGVMLKELIDALIQDGPDYHYRGKAAGDFVRSNSGATRKIIQFIQEKRLLTS